MYDGIKKKDLLCTFASKSYHKFEKILFPNCSFESNSKEKWLEVMNCRGVVFHCGNAPPHTVMSVRQQLNEYGWDVLCHPHIHQTCSLRFSPLQVTSKFTVRLRDFFFIGDCQTYLETVKQHLRNE